MNVHKYANYVHTETPLTQRSAYIGLLRDGKLARHLH